MSPPTLLVPQASERVSWVGNGSTLAMRQTPGDRATAALPSCPGGLAVRCLCRMTLILGGSVQSVWRARIVASWWSAFTCTRPAGPRRRMSVASLWTSTAPGGRTASLSATGIASPVSYTHLTLPTICSV
eukprot:8193611-Alexandrium_andersonii.AAC.1